MEPECVCDSGVWGPDIVGERALNFGCSTTLSKPLVAADGHEPSWSVLRNELKRKHWIMSPRVSVLLTSYNYAEYIGETIASVLGQRGMNDFEIVVIDDASTDDSLDVIDSFDDPRVRVVRHSSNQGHLGTMNEAFGCARAPYLVQIGADDRWRPDFLMRTVPILDAEPTVGLVHTNMALIDERGAVTQSRATNIPVPGGFKGNELRWLLFENYFPPHGTLFRREALDAIGGAFDARFPLSEDWRLWLNALKRWESYFLDEVLVEYRVHSRNLHSELSRSKRGEASEIAVLDEFFADPSLPKEVAHLAPRVYAAHLLRHAEVYFGNNQIRDARRCLRKSAGQQPSIALSKRWLIRFAASLAPRGLYRQLQHTKARLMPRAR